MASEIEWAKVTQISPEDYPAARGEGRPHASRSRPTRSPGSTRPTRRSGAGRHLVDFETILELTAAMMTEHRGGRAASPPAVPLLRGRRVSGRQPAAEAPARHLARRPRRPVCVVGDPNQTIYSFTGATPATSPASPSSIPIATVIKLVRDYRSTPQVVAPGQPACSRPGARTPAHASSWSRSGPTGPSRSSPSTTTSPPRPRPSRGGSSELVAGGVPTREIAVLFRVNAQSEVLRAGVRRGRRALSCCGAPSASSSARRSGRPSCLLRGAARSAERR